MNPAPLSFDGRFRRVVTGVAPDGRAVVTADERVEDDPRGSIVWAADAPPLAGHADTPEIEGWWPPPGGVRVTLSTRRPDAKDAPASTHARAFPDINDAQGFHASCSTDIVIVMSGTIWLELDDGVEVALEAGDTLIQNGTRHRWHNHGSEWPLMAVVIVGAIAPETARTDGENTP